MIRAIPAALLLALAPASHAAVLHATPATLPAIVAAAHCGDVIKVTGDFPTKVSISARPTCPVLLDLTAAKVAWLFWFGASNWNVIGGDFQGGLMGQQIINSDHLEFSKGNYHGFAVSAFVMTASNHITIHDNTIAHQRGDGVDVFSSQFITVADNHFFDLNYTPEQHTDLVQLLNIAGSPQVSDVTISGNDGFCHCQGFDNYGGAAGPMTRIKVTGNRFASDMLQAVAMRNVSNSSVTDNFAVTAVPQPRGWGGTQFFLTDNPLWTAPDSGKSGNVMSGNTAGAAP